ncbi:MAG: hypothetical protein ACLT1W_12570 [Alistipes onderdonkii]
MRWTETAAFAGTFGTLPAGQLASLCFSGRGSEAEVRKMICGAGGLVALTGSNDVKDLLERGAQAIPRPHGGRCDGLSVAKAMARWRLC